MSNPTTDSLPTGLRRPRQHTLRGFDPRRQALDYRVHRSADCNTGNANRLPGRVAPRSYFV